MRRPSLLRETTSDSEGPSQRQIWLFRLAKFLLVLTFVEDLSDPFGGAWSVASAREEVDELLKSLPRD